MKTSFNDYLLAIGIKELFLSRTLNVIKFYEEHFNQKIESIFITDYVDEKGERHYDSMWLFNEKFMMEAKQFLTKDDFDIAPYSKNIHYLNIQMLDYDFKKASSKSRMTVKFRVQNSIIADLKSSSENCDYLRDLYIEYFKKNLLV